MRNSILRKCEFTEGRQHTSTVGPSAEYESTSKTSSVALDKPHGEIDRTGEEGSDNGPGDNNDNDDDDDDEDDEDDEDDDDEMADGTMVGVEDRGHPATRARGTTKRR